MRVDVRLEQAQTERLTLRLPTERDFDAWLGWHDDVAQRGLGMTHAPPRWDAWRSLAMMVGHWHLRGFGMWVLEERATGRAIGRGGLFFPEGWPCLEVGWLLGPEARGKGYATEMGHKALELAFTVLQAERVCSLILPTNQESIAVATRLGERLAGQSRLRDAVDVDRYELSLADWRSRRAST